MSITQVSAAKWSNGAVRSNKIPSLVRQDLGKIVGGSLLVAGTCIGAGMLSLPVSTAAGGFYPSITVFLLVWFVMTFSALVMLEVSLWLPGETNLISMAKATLGRGGEYCAWIVYILFLYSLMAAYTASGADILGHAALKMLHFDAPFGLVPLVYTFLFALVVYFGARAVDYLNRFLIGALIAAYFMLSALVTPHVDSELLNLGQPHYLFAAVPLMVTSFGFHLLIPSLKSYMREHVQCLRLAIIIGSVIPLLIYLVWEFLILGVVPAQGVNGLNSMLQSGEPVVPLTQALDTLLGNSWISYGARFFTFFAVASSFIGVSLGLFDFMADGFHIKKQGFGKITLSTLTFLPPLVFALYYPHGFVMALGYAGIFGAILLILFPVTMAYVGRYHQQKKMDYRVVGGRPCLIIAGALAVLTILLEILDQLHLLPKPF